jgi:hypothetical protein
MVFDPETVAMVATWNVAASSEYYVRGAEYYLGEQEPDGVWYAPSGDLGSRDAAPVQRQEFARLYEGVGENGQSLRYASCMSSRPRLHRRMARPRIRGSSMFVSISITYTTPGPESPPHSPFRLAVRSRQPRQRCPRKSDATAPTARPHQTARRWVLRSVTVVERLR